MATIPNTRTRTAETSAEPSAGAGDSSSAKPVLALTVEKLGAALDALSRADFSWANRIIAEAAVSALRAAGVTLAGAGDPASSMQEANALLTLLKASVSNSSTTLADRVQKALDALV